MSDEQTKEVVEEKPKKKIRVREAKPRDIGLFKKLAHAYLKESSEQGSPIQASDHNLEVFCNLFNVYVTEKNYKGFVFFSGDYAVIMIGDAGVPIQTDNGKSATAFFIYSAPEKRKSGVMSAICEHAYREIKAAGFDTVEMQTLPNDEAVLKLIAKATGKDAETYYHGVRVRVKER